LNNQRNLVLTVDRSRCRELTHGGVHFARLGLDDQAERNGSRLRQEDPRPRPVLCGPEHRSRVDGRCLLPPLEFVPTPPRARPEQEASVLNVTRQATEPINGCHNITPWSWRATQAR